MTQPGTKKSPAQVITVQRKGRIKGGLIGGLLLGPIGLIGGALLGTRTQVTISDEEAKPKEITRGDHIRMGIMVGIIVVSALICIFI